MADKAKQEKKLPLKKKPTTLRERNKKAADAAEKPKRVRKTKEAVKKPIFKVGNALKTEYHVLPQSEKPGFFTKSRKLTPRYFRESWQELRKVTWPGRKETWKLVFAVFLFAMVLGVFIAGLDYLLERVFREVIL